MNVITLLLSATSQGMLWSLLAIGVLHDLSNFRYCRFDGRRKVFPLGGGIAAIGIVNGMHPALATLLAFWRWNGSWFSYRYLKYKNSKFQLYWPELLL